MSFRLAFMMLWAVPALVLAAEPAPDTPFRQETATKHAYLYESPGEPRCLAVSGSTVYVGFSEGLMQFDANNGAWHAVGQKELEGLPVFSILPVGDAIWLATASGLWRKEGESLEQVLKTEVPLSALCRQGDDILAAGPGQMYRVREGKARKLPQPDIARGVRAVAAPQAGLWMATGMGLYDLSTESFQLHQAAEEIVSSDVYDVAVDAAGRVWAAALGGVGVFEGGKQISTHTTANGIPGAWLSSIAMDTEGGVWVGTQVGAARYDGKRWSVRHSQRWLLDDKVVDIAADDTGGVWIATATGLSHIAARQMTLAEKAAYFEQVCDERHVREPGFVEKIRLLTPGDLSEWQPEDDDNEGEYTAQYLSAQAHRWAATRDLDAKAKARRSWEALVFLQTVTGTPGFIARSAIAPDWERMHDPNLTYSAAELALAAVDEPRYKPVEERWRMSVDGKWRWKGDTSSDEITGHYYAFGVYYDLVADEEEKPAIRAHVARVTDYLLDHGYYLVDVDGKPTRWGVWAPERLNDDPDWRIDRTINSAEMLGYLLTAWHVTGDKKYRQHYLDLAHNHHYLENARLAKNFAPAWITHIDDCLLVLVYRALINYEPDPATKKVYEESLAHWYEGIRGEQNPWFNYCMGAYSGKEPQREDSLFFLRDTPLDLIAYTVSQREREDVGIVRKPILEDLQTDRMLPPSERATVRWDKNPWQAVDGHGGHVELAPTFWLIAYWIGRAGGFIAE